MSRERSTARTQLHDSQLNLRPRKDPKRGTWFFVVDVGIKPDGTRTQIYRRGFRTKADAQRELDNLRRDRREGTFVLPVRQRFGDFLLAMAQEDPSRITVWLVLEAARAGDKMCWNIVAEIAEEIGVAMANLVNLFNPAMIVFDQRLSGTGDEFSEPDLACSKKQCAGRFRIRAVATFRNPGERSGTAGCGPANSGKAVRHRQERTLGVPSCWHGT